MQSKFTLQKSFAGIAGRLLLLCCLVGLVSANAAPVVFTATGSFVDGSTLSGTLTIDTATGAATAVNISITTPAGFTANFIQLQAQFVGGTQTLVLGAAVTGNPTFVMTLPVNSLVGYTGGAMSAPLSNYTLTGSPNVQLASGSLSTGAPPSILKVFGAVSVPLNGTTSLTFTVTNPNASAPLSAVTFTDTLPAGLVVAGGLTKNCSGAVTAVSGSGSISLASSALAANSSCAVSVNVMGTTAGVKNNSVTVSDATAGVGNTSNATLTVFAPPAFTSKTFANQILTFDPNTTVTFVITNPNTFGALNGVAFTDALPGALVVATPSVVTNTCGGSVSAPPNGSTITLSGGVISAGSSCTITVAVTGLVSSDGIVVNTTSPVSSVTGGTGTAASAVLTNAQYMLFLWFFS